MKILYRTRLTLHAIIKWIPSPPLFRQQIWGEKKNCLIFG